MPTRPELESARDKTVRDLIAPDLKVLFVGINPSLMSGLIGHHFGNPANRLWRVLHEAGFTDRRLHPTESGELLDRGYGITNFVMRTTARADEVSDDEIRAGAKVLRRKILKWQPRHVAFLGMGAYRVGFGQPKATVGMQPAPIGESIVWLLPNPSGLNANYQMPDLVRLYREVRVAAEL